MKTMIPVKPVYFIPLTFRNGRWQSDLVHLRTTFKQLCKQAGLPTSPTPHPADAWDRLLVEAGKYNMGLETTDTK